MTSVGSVEVSVRLGLQQLQADAAKAQQELQNAIKDVQVGVSVNSDVGQATQELKTFRTEAQKPIAVPLSIGTGGDISELARNLNLTFKEAKNFAQAIGLSADQSNRAIATIRELNTVNATSVEKFRVLARELGVTKQQYLALEQGIEQATQAQSAFEKLIETARGFNEAVSAASQYTQALREVSDLLGQAATRVNAFSQQALQAATAFDSAQGKVGTLSSDVDGLTNALTELTQELDYQTNTTDLLNASYDVLSSGFSDTADVTEILRAATLGAQGGFTDVGTVTDALTTVMNAYGFSADKAAYLTDILAQTQDKGKITIGQYAGQIGEVASTAALAGVSIEEVSAAIATATAKGQTASASISGVRQAIVNILKPTDEAQRYLEKFGIQNAAATLRAEGLVGVLARLQQAGATTDDLAKIFSDVTGLATVATLAGKNLEGFTANIEAMTNSTGKAAKSAGVVAQTFDSQVARAFNLANESLVDLGRGVQGALLPLINALVFLLENFNKLPDSLKQGIGVFIAVSGGALTLASALAGVAAVLPVVSAAAKALGGNLKGIAFSPTAIAATAAVAALALAADTFTEVTEASRETRQGVKDVEAALQELENTAASNALSTGLSDFANSLGETDAAVQEAIDTNIKAIEDKLNGVQKFLDRIRTLIEQILNNPIVKAALAVTPGAGAVTALLPKDEQGNIDIGTAAEAAVTQQDLAFDDLIGSTDKVIAKFSELKDAGFASQPTEDLQKLNGAVEQSIAALEASAPVTESDIRNKEAQLNVLRQLQTELGAYVGSAETATDATATAAEATGEQTDALAKLEAANKAAEAALVTSQNNQIAAVKRLQAEKQISAEEAESRITAIEQNGIDQRITQTQSAIQKVNDLKASGQITEEEAIAKLSELEQQRSELNLQAIDAEIAAQQRLAEARVEALNQQLADTQTGGEVATGRLDIQSGALSGESSLLTAQNDLLTAQSNLRQQNLQGAIALATAEGNTNEVFRLRKELASEQRNLLTSQQEIQRRQLEISQQQRDLDLERQRINAEIAVAEAEIAIQKAQAEGASAAEVANLEKILGLRKEQLAAVGTAIESNEELKDLEDAALEANQALEKSKAAQAESMQSQVDSAKELQEIQNSTQNTQNQSAIDAAQAAYDDRPTTRNLKALQDARQKAIDDEFNQRQEALDAENKFAIDNATEQANAAGEAYQEALGKFNQAGLDARADGTITDEEQKKLDLMQDQTTEAEKQAKLANQEVTNQKNLAKAKQDQLNADRKAAQDAENRKRQEESKKNVPMGFVGADVSFSQRAQAEFKKASDSILGEKGIGQQFQSLLNFAQRDIVNRSGKNPSLDFADLQLSKLGGVLGNTALQLEKIADGGQAALAQNLAKALDQAQVSGNNADFQGLIDKIGELAAKAGPSIGSVSVSAPDPIGAAGQILRDIRAGDSKQRGL